MFVFDIFAGEGEVRCEDVGLDMESKKGYFCGYIPYIRCGRMG